MLSGFKRLLSGSQSREEVKIGNHPQWNLQERPFIAALLDRHIHEASAAHRDLRGMIGDMPNLSFSDKLDKAVESAIVSTTSAVMMHAMSDQGISLVHLRGDPWPKNHVAGCVFGCHIAVFMRGHSNAEGVETNLQQILAGVLASLTLAHPEDEIRTLHSYSIPEVQKLLEANDQGIRDWMESIDTLAQGHVLQWNTDNPKLAQIETRKLFSEHFGSLLRTLN